MLLVTAANIIHEETVNLTEFLVAPLSMNNFSVEHNCHAENISSNESSFTLADALNAPFFSRYFDTVLTPWLIDIIPMDLKKFIPNVNRLLKVGGTWINTGSLAFFHEDIHWNYSQEEVVDLLGKHGFDEIKVNRVVTKYLSSPYSAHGRTENVFSFSARKKFDTLDAEKFNYYPELIDNSHLAIPARNELLAASSKHLLQAQVLFAIDVNRSISEIAQLLARQYEMPQSSALAAVRQILIDNL